MGLVEVRLQREKNDGPDILTHEDAERDPAGQGGELEFVIEQFHDDQRAAQRQRYGQIKPVEIAAGRRESHEKRQADAQADTE